jgi:PIN domain nuclease of toxin-antitoxin system
MGASAVSGFWEWIEQIARGSVSSTLHLGVQRTERCYNAIVESTVIGSHTLTAIPDIFDRLIVAEARRLSLPLITRDTAISGSGLVSVVWD